MAVAIAVIVVLVAPSVDLPDTTEARFSHLKTIVAPIAIVAAAVPAFAIVFSGAARNWVAAAGHHVPISLTDLCCVRLC